MCEKEVLRYHLRLFVFTPSPAPRPPAPPPTPPPPSFFIFFSYFFCLFSLHSNKTPVKTAAHGNRTSMFITFASLFYSLVKRQAPPTPRVFRPPSHSLFHRRICLVPFRHIFVCISSIRQTIQIQMPTCKMQPGQCPCMGSYLCVWGQVCACVCLVCVCVCATIGGATPRFLGGLLLCVSVCVLIFAASLF